MSEQNEHLQNAQRLFRTVTKYLAPMDTVPDYIDSINSELRKAAGNTGAALDYSQLKPGVTHAQVARYFDALTALLEQGKVAYDGMRKLKPEMETAPFDALFNAELSFARKANALSSARRVLEERVEYGTHFYNHTAEQHVDPEHQLPTLFERAGLDASIFTSGQNIKTSDLLDTVRKAEIELTHGRGGPAR